MLIPARCSQVDVGNNSIGKEQALNLISIFKEKDQMVSVGLERCCDLGVDGAKAVADYVSVSASLTDLNLANNSLTGGKYVKESKLAGSSFKSGDKVIYEGQELTVLAPTDSDGDVVLGSVEGIIAIADALGVNASLTKIECACPQNEPTWPFIVPFYH